MKPKFPFPSAKEWQKEQTALGEITNRLQSEFDNLSVLIGRLETELAQKEVEPDSKENAPTNFTSLRQKGPS